MIGESQERTRFATRESARTTAEKAPFDILANTAFEALPNAAKSFKNIIEKLSDKLI